MFASLATRVSRKCNSRKARKTALKAAIIAHSIHALTLVDVWSIDGLIALAATATIVVVHVFELAHEAEEEIEEAA